MKLTLLNRSIFVATIFFRIINKCLLFYSHTFRLNTDVQLLMNFDEFVNENEK